MFGLFSASLFCIPNIFFSSSNFSLFNKFKWNASSMSLPIYDILSDIFTFYPVFLYFFFSAIKWQIVYSTLFRDSTISIFFNFWCINRFTIMENPIVSSPQYRKLTGLIFLPNITASTSTVRIIYLCKKIPNTAPASTPMKVRITFSLYT